MLDVIGSFHRFKSINYLKFKERYDYGYKVKGLYHYKHGLILF